MDRLDQGFDHAPMVSRAKVAGRVSKPRDMWIVQGAGKIGYSLGKFDGSDDDAAALVEYAEMVDAQAALDGS